MSRIVLGKGHVPSSGGVSCGQRSFLRNISALSPTDVWASGETDPDSSPPPLLEH
jgi:hypothetical protein